MPNDFVSVIKPTAKTGEVVRSTGTPRAVPVLPVRDTVLFPHAVLPLTVGRESSIQLIQSLGEEKTILVVAQRDARLDAAGGRRPACRGHARDRSQGRQDAEPEPVRLHRGQRAGEAGRLYPDAAVSDGRVRDRAEVEPAKSPELEALQRNVVSQFQQIVTSSPTLSDDLQTIAINIDEAGRLADFIASQPAVSDDGGQAGAA